METNTCEHSEHVYRLFTSTSVHLKAVLLSSSLLYFPARRRRSQFDIRNCLFNSRVWFVHSLRMRPRCGGEWGRLCPARSRLRRAPEDTPRPPGYYIPLWKQNIARINQNVLDSSQAVCTLGERESAHWTRTNEHHHYRTQFDVHATVLTHTPLIRVPLSIWNIFTHGDVSFPFRTLYTAEVIQGSQSYCMKNAFIWIFFFLH